MNYIKIDVTQADIIFKALHYVAFSEAVDVPEELYKVFQVLAEYNPGDTYAEDTLDVMGSLSSFIKSNDPYKYYFDNDILDK